MSKDCGYKKPNETVAQYRQRCGPRPLGMISRGGSMKEKKNPRIPRKKGQPAGSKKHSDLYTDENPKGTIHGLKFKTVKDAKASVSKIRNSGKKHAHKIQAAVAMEQRARAAGKTSQAAVYRAFINKMKKKTKQQNEHLLPESMNCLCEKCWKGYEKKGYKTMFGKRYPNCVKKENVAPNHDGKAAPYGSGYKKTDVEENLRKWFKDKWVNIGKKRKDGSHPPCGTSGKKRGYAKCVPASKAARMTKKQKDSAVRRKRAAQNKAGRGGTSSIKGGGKKPIRVKTKAESKMNFSKETIQEMILEEYCNILSEKKDACYHKVKARYDVWPSAYASGALVKCRKVGAANWGNKSKKENVEEMDIQLTKQDMEKLHKNKKVTKNDIDIEYDVVNEQDSLDFMNYMNENYWRVEESQLEEAEYKGRKVKLGKPMRGDVKKFKVYVKNPKGNVVKVNFGQGGKAKGGTMRIRKSNPAARRSFRARHNCDNPGPRHKARYWSCKKW